MIETDYRSQSLTYTAIPVDKIPASVTKLSHATCFIVQLFQIPLLVSLVVFFCVYLICVKSYFNLRFCLYLYIYRRKILN